ncbi:hypothetical protein GQ44DRAFT_729061 [Phaeosphaeriaceae sp. PMI808]|nr:hypothetical protein GQ44DRAFT_729061 [Phaeosphaeriaceae sp. PMI808]
MSCYKPDGSLNTYAPVQPCNQVAGSFSMCCGTNHTAKGIAKDVCTPNGLCQNFITYPSGKTFTTYWRATCSDPTWNSPFCLKNICFDDLDLHGHKTIQNCTDGTWCCGADETASCCSNGSPKIKLAATVGLPVSSSASSSSSSTPTFSQTSPSTSPSTSNTPSDSPSGMSIGAKAGIGIGVALGVCILIGILVGLYVRRSRQNKLNGGINQDYQYGKPELDGSTVKYRSDATIVESDSRPKSIGPYELHGEADPSELPEHGHTAARGVR